MGHTRVEETPQVIDRSPPIDIATTLTHTGAFQQGLRAKCQTEVVTPTLRRPHGPSNEAAHLAQAWFERARPHGKHVFHVRDGGGAPAGGFFIEFGGFLPCRR